MKDSLSDDHHAKIHGCCRNDTIRHFGHGVPRNLLHGRNDRCMDRISAKLIGESKMSFPPAAAVYKPAVRAGNAAPSPTR